MDAARGVPGSRVERKGASVAVHYRAADDPSIAHEQLAAGLAPIADEAGLELLPGKMVIELVPAGRPLKEGGRADRRRRGLEAVLYAGDDVADLRAFEALDRLAERGVRTVKVAVHGRDPGRAEAAADVVVDGPAGLVTMLRRSEARRTLASAAAAGSARGRPPRAGSRATSGVCACTVRDMRARRARSSSGISSASRMASAVSARSKGSPRAPGAPDG